MIFLKRQLYFTRQIKRKILIGLILCIYLNFIVIVLQPFDTSQFDAEYKTLLLSGYGLFTFIIFLIQGSIENLWYFRAGKVWLVSYEIISSVVFCLFAHNVLYFYNIYIVNYGSNPAIGSYLRFFFVTVTGMIPVFIPPMLYLRQKFGERIVPIPNNFVLLTGENKNEILTLEKKDLLFIKAVENYIEVCFVDHNNKISSKTFRQTLSNVCKQLPFLEKCHRSYL